MRLSSSLFCSRSMRAATSGTATPPGRWKYSPPVAWAIALLVEHRDGLAGRAPDADGEDLDARGLERLGGLAHLSGEVLAIGEQHDDPVLRAPVRPLEDLLRRGQRRADVGPALLHLIGVDGTEEELCRGVVRGERA